MTEVSKGFKGFMFLVFISMVAVLFLPGNSCSEQYKVLGDRDLYVTGFISQGVQFGFNDPKFSTPSPLGGAYQTDGFDKGATSLLTTLYLENQLEWNDCLEFRLSLRWEGDMVDNFHDNSRQWMNGSGQAFGKYSDKADIEGDDSINDVIRECTVAYFSHFVSMRVGKQLLGWGEADGLKLMDQVNPVDLRRDWFLRDSDESMVPLWMVKTDITPDYAFGSPLGFQNLDLEVTWIPDVKRANLSALGPREGGPWGAPLPDLPLPLKQLNALEDYPERRKDNTSCAVRLKGFFLGTYFTLNGYYGWAKNPVLVGSGNASNLDLVLDPNFQGNAADADGTDFSPLFIGAGLLPPMWTTPVYGAELTLNKKLYRQKFIGCTLSRELPVRQVVKAIGQSIAPVIRVEALYEKDVRFTIGTDDYNQATFSTWIWETTDDAIKERDIYRYLVGLDWNVNLDWLNPDKVVLLSAQFAQNRMCGDVDVADTTVTGAKQRLQYAPYFWFPKKVETFSTLLINSGYLNNNLIPEILVVKDWTYDAYIIKYKVNYSFRDNWRFEAGYYQIDGEKEESFGIYDNADSIYGVVKYQF